MNPLFQLSNLRVRREGQTVLDIESLSVERGEVLAIVGPNGAGKSTLFLVLARLLRADEGQVLFEGRPTESLHDLEYRRQIALVLQESLLMDMSVYENTALGLKFRNRSKAEIQERVNHWLDRLGIAHLSERRPANFPAARPSASVWRGHSFCVQLCSCWMNHLHRWMRPPVSTCLKT